MAQAKIGNIRFKKGGATLRILNTLQHDKLDEPNWSTLLLQHARYLATPASDPDAPVVGYFMLAVYADGRQASASRLDSRLCPIPLNLWPSYVEEIARRRTINGVDVHQIISDFLTK